MQLQDHFKAEFSEREKKGRWVVGMLLEDHAVQSSFWMLLESCHHERVGSHHNAVMRIFSMIHQERFIQWRRIMADQLHMRAVLKPIRYNFDQSTTGVFLQHFGEALNEHRPRFTQVLPKVWHIEICCRDVIMYL